MTLESFLAEVADRTPAPGGGAAAGVGCALGAALVEMAARFAGLEEPASRAAELRQEALELAETDRTAYAPVLAALRLPADDPSRADALLSAQSAAAPCRWRSPRRRRRRRCSRARWRRREAGAAQGRARGRGPGGSVRTGGGAAGRDQPGVGGR